MNAMPGPERPLEALRRLYDIYDRLTWASMDLIELADDAAEQLPAISRECRNCVAGIRVVETAVPGTAAGEPPLDRVYADWQASHGLLQAGYERIVDFEYALTLLPELGRLRDQVTDALPALRAIAHESDRAGLARLDRERDTERPRPRNRLRRERVRLGGADVPSGLAATAAAAARSGAVGAGR